MSQQKLTEADKVTSTLLPVTKQDPTPETLTIPKRTHFTKQEVKIREHSSANT